MEIGIKEFKYIFKEWSDLFIQKRDYLIKTDSVLGDGDLGITMSKIFSSSYEVVNNSTDDDLGKLLLLSGMTMAKTAPSTMGTLMGSAFIEAGKLLKNKNVLNLSDWEIFFQGLQQGIAKRGKAKVGDKTILDIFYPSYLYVKENKFESEVEMFKSLQSYAKECLENTSQMEAQHGKAACFGEKSIGHIDAGATVAYLLIDSLAKSINDFVK